MSEPKTLVVPERFSARVLGGALGAVMSAQAELEATVAELRRLKVSLPDGRVETCRADLDAAEGQLKAALGPLPFRIPADMDEGTLATLRDGLTRHLAKVNEASARVGQARQKVEEHRADAAAYVAAVEHGNACSAAFERHREEVLTYLRANPGAVPVRLREVSAAISQVRLPARTPAFARGFRGRAKDYKRLVDADVAEGRKAIGLARERMGAPRGAPAAPATAARPAEGKVTESIAAIQGLLERLEDAELRASYQRRLEHLMANDQIAAQAYFYDELHDDLLRDQKERALRRQVREQVERLRRDGVEGVREDAILAPLVGRRRLREEDVTALAARVEAELVRRRAEVEAMSLAHREQEFVRQQVVEGLMALGGYRTLETQVIDFAQGTAYLLEASNQESYLDLRFHEDGTFAYRFMLLEAPGGDLERERAELQLEEACTLFQQVLQGLRRVGVPIEIQAEGRPTEPRTYPALAREVRERLGLGGRDRGQERAALKVKER